MLENVEREVKVASAHYLDVEWEMERYDTCGGIDATDVSCRCNAII